MTLRLTVHTAAWRGHVVRTAAAIDGLIPVVKGNGYGFGRSVLLAEVADLAGFVCVGTVYELDDVPHGVTPVVLTPTLVAPSDTRVILTVGSTEHVSAVGDWPGRVMVKLRSSMHRYGVAPGQLDDLLRSIAGSAATPFGFALHLPLAGDDAARVAEVEAWLPHLDPEMPLWLSHLSPSTFAALQAAHATREFHLRVGTALWHGDKSFLKLSADVLDVSPVVAGAKVGYRHAVVPANGNVVVIGAGSAHGVAPLTDGASPFHFERKRLHLLEAPHMHSSLAFVPQDDQCPVIGDRVDVQRPLITTTVDMIEWL